MQSQYRNNLRIAATALLAIMLTAGCVSRPAPPDADHFPPLKKSDLAGEVQFRLIFGGDTAFGESYLLRSDLPTDPPPRFEKFCGRGIQKLQSFTDEATAVVVNLETPITDARLSPFRDQKGYIHWGHTALTLRLLQKLNVESVSLANNHSLDYGSEGLNDTFNALSSNGINYFGAGNNGNSAARPWTSVFSTGSDRFKVAVLGGMHYRTRYDTEYSFYAGETTDGVNLLTEESTRAQVEDISAAHPGAFLVVFPHWGRNYERRSEQQRRLARAMIDAGADLVLGHGAHMFQEIVRMNERWIVYSLGNFVFNSPGRYDQKDAPPFSLVAVLVGRTSDNGLQLNLRLYPIFSNNKRSNYQPRFLSDKEFLQAQKHLLDWSNQKSTLFKNIRSGMDTTGRFLWIPLRR